MFGDVDFLLSQMAGSPEMVASAPRTSRKRPKMVMRTALCCP